MAASRLASGPPRFAQAVFHSNEWRHKKKNGGNRQRPPRLRRRLGCHAHEGRPAAHAGTSPGGVERMHQFRAWLARNDGGNNEINPFPILPCELPAVQRSAGTAGPIPTPRQQHHTGVSKTGQAWQGDAGRRSPRPVPAAHVKAGSECHARTVIGTFCKTWPQTC